VLIEIQLSFTYASMMSNLFDTNIFNIYAAFGALLFAANPNVAPDDCKRVAD